MAHVTRRWWVLGAVVGVGAVVAAVRSPWPSAFVIRAAFTKGGRETDARLRERAPSTVTRTADVGYAPGDRDALLDVYRPTDATVDLPTVVWVHGGGFVAGSKDELVGYLTILAAQGYTVVGVDYTRAPEATYPTPVRQVMAALGHLAAHAGSFGIDLSRVVLAGDSAGAQIAAQTANILVSPSYARAVGIAPTMRPVVGTVLFCGAYDLSLARGSSRAGDWFVATVLRAYLGTRRWTRLPGAEYFSLVDHVTADFPPAFVSAGDADPLLPHSSSLVAHLTDAGVEVEALFFEPGRGRGHEYQFALDTDAGAESFDRMTAFLRRRMG